MSIKESFNFRLSPDIRTVEVIKRESHQFPELGKYFNKIEDFAWTMLVDAARTSGTEANKLICAFYQVDENYITHLVIDKDTYEFINALKIPELATGQSFHLPFKSLKISTPDGGIDVVYDKNAFDKTEKYFKLQNPAFKMNGYDTGETEFILGIDTDNDAELNSRLTPDQLTDIVQKNKAHWTHDPLFAKLMGIALNDEEKKRLTDSIKFVFKLGMLLSVKGVSSLYSTTSKIKKYKGKKILKFKREILPARSETRFFVMPFMRQLKDEKYYKGAYESWPRGTRFTMVSAHERTRKS